MLITTASAAPARSCARPRVDAEGPGDERAEATYCTGLVMRNSDTAIGSTSDGDRARIAEPRARAFQHRRQRGQRGLRAGGDHLRRHDAGGEAAQPLATEQRSPPAYSSSVTARYSAHSQRM